MMDKVKAYDEALERAKGLLDSPRTCFDINQLKDIFPQLKDSDDERVRKSLIEFLTDIKEISESGRTVWAVRENDAEMCESFIAYLEKQKECVIDNTSEDEKMLQTIIQGFKNWKANGMERFNGTKIDDILVYLEKRKYNRMQPVYDNQESFESALDKAWKAYNDCGSRIVDSCEDDYIESAYAKGFREGYLFGLEKQKEASKAIEAIERIDKYIDKHLANAHDMKDSNPDKKYYRGWDDALGAMAGILQDVYSGEKQKESLEDFIDDFPYSANSIPSDIKYENSWHKVVDSFPDSTREVICKDAIGNFFIGRYYKGNNSWEVSMYDDINKSNEDNPPVVMWCDIPSEKQKEQNSIKMEVCEVGKGTTICGKDYKCKKDYKVGNCQYIKDATYHCGRDGYLTDQNGVSWSCTPEWFNEYIYTDNELADKEKNDFVSGQFLQCKLSFDEFKEGECYWLEYVGDDIYVGRSDNVLGKKFHITPIQLYTLFSHQQLEEVQGPPQEEKQVSLNYEPPFNENPSDREIIEALIHSLNEQDGFLTAINGVSTKAILSWLEKQKRHEPIKVGENAYFDPNTDMWFIKEEQKSIEWSDNFEQNIRKLLHDKLSWYSEDGNMSSTVFIDDKTLKDIINGIWFYVGKEALKYPGKELNVTEWSEEDEMMRENIISDLQYFRDCATDKEAVSDYDDEINWLKDIFLNHKKFTEAVDKLWSNEWNEEDEKDIAHIIQILDDCYAYGRHDLSKTDHENLVNKLKSLHPIKQGWTEEDKKNLENIRIYLLHHGEDAWANTIAKLKSLRPSQKSNEK